MSLCVCVCRYGKLVKDKMNLREQKRHIGNIKKGKRRRNGITIINIKIY